MPIFFTPAVVRFPRDGRLVQGLLRLEHLHEDRAELVEFLLAFGGDLRRIAELDLECAGDGRLRAAIIFAGGGHQTWNSTQIAIVRGFDLVAEWNGERASRSGLSGRSNVSSAAVICVAVFFSVTGESGASGLAAMSTRALLMP